MSEKKRGRPFDPNVADALKAAASRIMSTDGYGALSVDRLVKEVGTTRPTFYRRYPSIAFLALDVLSEFFGEGADVNTGTLLGDFIRLQELEIKMFSSQLMRKSLPGFLEAVNTEPEIARICQQGFIEPRRALVHAAVSRAILRGEIAPPKSSVDYVCDLLLGPILARAVLPLGAELAPDEYAKLTAQTAFAELSK